MFDSVDKILEIPTTFLERNIFKFALVYIKIIEKTLVDSEDV